MGQALKCVWDTLYIYIYFLLLYTYIFAFCNWDPRGYHVLITFEIVCTFIAYRIAARVSINVTRLHPTQLPISSDIRPVEFSSERRMSAPSRKRGRIHEYLGLPEIVESRVRSNVAFIVAAPSKVGTRTLWRKPNANQRPLDVDRSHLGIQRKPVIVRGGSGAAKASWSVPSFAWLYREIAGTEKDATLRPFPPLFFPALCHPCPLRLSCSPSYSIDHRALLSRWQFRSWAGYSGIF